MSQPGQVELLISVLLDMSRSALFNGSSKFLSYILSTEGPQTIFLLRSGFLSISRSSHLLVPSRVPLDLLYIVFWLRVTPRFFGRDLAFSPIVLNSFRGPLLTQIPVPSSTVQRLHHVLSLQGIFFWRIAYRAFSCSEAGRIC